MIWRKPSFCTQIAAGSRFVEALLSVIETCRRQLPISVEIDRMEITE